MQLSKYFSWDEATITGTGLINEPDGLLIKSNIIKCSVQMDMLREFIGGAIKINSWYRSERVNSAVGGAKNSAHMSGWAVDFVCPSIPNWIVAKKIEISDIKFDQLILEPTWIHISFDPKNRRDCLTLKRKGSPYLKGIIIQ